MSRTGPSALTGYDHLFYDVNNVIYSLVSKSRNEEQFYLKLYKEIDAIMKAVRPRQTLFMAVDGPGPRAKVRPSCIFKSSAIFTFFP